MVEAKKDDDLTVEIIGALALSAMVIAIVMWFATRASSRDVRDVEEKIELLEKRFERYVDDKAA